MNVNSVTLAGRLTRDPQLRYLPNQTPVVEFGLGVTERFKDKEKSNFFDVTAFGKQAELINQHMAKGRPIFLMGRLSFEQWDDKTTGQKRSKVKVILDTFQFVGPREGGQRQQRDAGNPSEGRDAPHQDEPSQEPPFDDDIPY